MDVAEVNDTNWSLQQEQIQLTIMLSWWGGNKLKQLALQPSAKTAMKLL